MGSTSLLIMYLMYIVLAVINDAMALIPFPHEIKNVTEAEDKLVKTYYKGYIRPFLRVGPSGYLSYPRYADHAEEIYNLEVRPDDVWVASFSRSGTTWLQELVWLVANDLNYEASEKEPNFSRYTFIEYGTQEAEVEKKLPPAQIGGDRATLYNFQDFHTLPSPRFVKTHLPLSLLPPRLLDTAKVLYIARDPRDVAVSFFFMHKLFRYFEEDVQFADYWQLFKKDLVARTPIFPHVEEFWRKRSHPNLMFLFYEEMQKDLPAVIDRVCKFLSKDYTQEQKLKLAEYLSFENMSQRNRGVKKTKPDQNTEIKFFRKGQSGKWLNYFNTTELAREANEYMEEHLKNTDLRFPTV